MLGIACIALSVTVLHNKKVNNALKNDMEVATASLLQTSDKERDCTKKLAAKTAELAPKDQAVATLTAEKEKLQEQVNQLTAQLENFKKNQTVLNTDNEKPTSEVNASAEANESAATEKLSEESTEAPK